MPVVAPLLGAFVGVLVYQLMVGFHVEGEVREKAEQEEESVKLSNVSTKEADWAALIRALTTSPSPTQFLLPILLQPANGSLTFR